MQSFGGFLKYARTHKGLTQEEVAQSLNIASPVISKWENDKGVPSLDLLCGLCNLYAISLEDCLSHRITEGSVLPPAQYDAAALGRNIRDLRIRNGWSQEELGKKLFVVSQTVSKWEKGGITSLSTLKQCADVFGLTPTQLLCGLQSPPPAAEPKNVSPVRRRRTKFIVILCAVILAVSVAALSAWAIMRAAGCGQSQDTDSQQGVTFIHPVENPVILRSHGDIFYDPTFDNYKGHCGIDYAADVGTPVFCVADCTVIDCYENIYGNAVIELSCENGLVIQYKYATPTEQFAKGQKLSRGQHIATIAEPCGEIAKDVPHVELKFYLDGADVDPMDYLPELSAS